jgi:hypothetical protein
MAVVGDVFGLNAVYDRQVENVENDNFNSWPETIITSGDRGYYAGGFSPPYINTISRLDFTNETISDPGNNLPTARGSSAAVSNNSYGYFGGGRTPSYINTISRLDFTNETLSNPGNNLPTVRYASAGTSSSSYGYYAGGSTPSYINTISRLDFTNETVSNPGNNLPTVRYASAGTSSSSYGYFGGGFSPPYINTISRLDFTNETVSNPGNNLPTSRSDLAATGTGNTNLPYIAKYAVKRNVNDVRTSGYSKRYPGSIYYKYNFPTSTWTTVPGGNPGYRSYAVANNSHAYVSREPFNSLAKFDFVSETNTTSFPYPSPTNNRMTGFANKNYGYFTGGNGDPSAPTIDEKIRRIEFETDSRLELSEQLPLGRESHGTIYNENYGYLCGGRLPDTNQVQRMDFSNETMSTLPPSSNLPHGTALVHLGYTNSNQAGYFVGGFSRSTIFKLDFSTENASSPGNVGSETREGYAMGGEYEGYFGGGYFNGITDMKKLDYSSDTLSNTGSNPPVSIEISATFNNGL